MPMSCDSSTELEPIDLDEDIPFHELRDSITHYGIPDDDDPDSIFYDQDLYDDHSHFE